MPTRILEVSEDSIKLRCDMTNKPFDYLVLSHMWGENHGNQLLLQKANIEEFKKNVPMQELATSATFREAIRVTRALGYHYIWIDSLCIVQDSKSDWDYEASRMAIVYGNAVCNIACLFPPDSDEQPTTREDPRVWHPCILRPATPSRPGVYIEQVNRAWILGDKRYGREWLMQNKWPLFNRAWTFQEYLLSPRTLLLGHKNLMYQCTQFFYDELLGPLGISHNNNNSPLSSLPTTATATSETKLNLDADLCKSKYFPPSLSTVTKTTDPCAINLMAFQRTWLSLINEYRARKLSFGKDRIIAIAGIARAFAHLGDLTYLAGTWAQCLPVGLLWYMTEKPSLLASQHNDIAPGPPVSYTVQVNENVITDGQGKKVPSWSFFNVPIYAFHHLGSLFGDDEVSAKRKSMADLARVCFDNVFWGRLLAFRWMGSPEGQVPVTAYSDFTDLRLTLGTKMVPVSSVWLTDIFKQLWRIRKGTACTADRKFDCDPIFKYHADDISVSGGELPKNAVLALVADVQIVRLAVITLV
ncbi:hypothetical protein G6011_09479 [Alternaria panax]|uniref:Heterokaryon incompatibility domain-containing protein n=1 Tax=Alternaria panax TaxID=48097 RepID=A0AAD4NMP4_9PLEO|nr:hypothetical protein G6011_09479 [Alternaria panax]